MRTFGIVMLALVGCGRTSDLPDDDDGEPPLSAPVAGAGAFGSAGASGTAASGAAGQVGSAERGGEGGGGAGTGGGAAASGGSVEGSACDGRGKLTLERVEIIDSGGDGFYATGEYLEVVGHVSSSAGPARAVLRITGDEPRVELQADSDTVEAELAAGETSALKVPYRVRNMMSGSEVAFALELSDGEEPSCTPRSVLEREIKLSVAGEDMQFCDMTRQLALSDPRVIDIDGDGRPAPGESFELWVTLTNPGPLPHNWYPGVGVVESHPALSQKDASYLLYALGSGYSAELVLEMQVGPDVPLATAAAVTLMPIASGLRCRHMTTLEHAVLVTE